MGQIIAFSFWSGPRLSYYLCCVENDFRGMFIISHSFLDTRFIFIKSYNIVINKKVINGVILACKQLVYNYIWNDYNWLSQYTFVYISTYK